MTADKPSKFPATETRRESTERSKHGDKKVDNFHQARLEAYGPRETTPKAEKSAYPEMDVHVPNYKGAQFPPVKVHIGPEDAKEITKHYNELVKGQDVSKFTQADIQKYQALATADVFIDKYQKGLTQQELDFTNWMPDIIKGPILASQALNDGAALGAAKSVLHKIIAEGALGDLASGTAMGLAFGKVVAKLAANINPWVRGAAILCQAGGIGLLLHQIGDIGQRSLDGLNKAGPELQNLLTHPSKENLEKAKKIVEQQLGPPLADAGLVALGFAAASGAEKLGGKLVKPGTGKPTETPTAKPNDKPTTPAQAGEKPLTTKPSEKAETQKPTDKQPETQEKPTPTKPLEKPSQKAVDQDVEYKTTDRISNKLEDGHTDVGSGNAIDKNGNFKSTRAGITYDKAHDAEYKNFVDGAKQHLNNWLKTHKNASTEQKLECLGRYVKDKLSSGAKDAAELNSKYLKLLNDNKGKRIPIGELIKKGIGACSEQATLLKAVADEAIPEAKLQLVRGKQGTGAGGTNHVWTETAKGEIIDPRRGVYGKPASEAPDYTPGSKLSESQKHGSAGEKLTVGKPLEGAPEYRVEKVDGKNVTLTHDAKTTVPKEELSELRTQNPNASFTKGEKLNDGRIIEGYDKNGGLVLKEPNAIRVTVPRNELYKHIAELQQLGLKVNLIDDCLSALPAARKEVQSSASKLQQWCLVQRDKGKLTQERVDEIWRQCHEIGRAMQGGKYNFKNIMESYEQLRNVAKSSGNKELHDLLFAAQTKLRQQFSKKQIPDDDLRAKLETKRPDQVKDLIKEVSKTDETKIREAAAKAAFENPPFEPTNLDLIGKFSKEFEGDKTLPAMMETLTNWTNTVSKANWKFLQDVSNSFGSATACPHIALKPKYKKQYDGALFKLDLGPEQRMLFTVNITTGKVTIVKIFGPGQKDACEKLCNELKNN